jgi:hypothetical protein
MKKMLSYKRQTHVTGWQARRCKRIGSTSKEVQAHWVDKQGGASALGRQVLGCKCVGWDRPTSKQLCVYFLPFSHHRVLHYTSPPTSSLGLTCLDHAHSQFFACSRPLKHELIPNLYARSCTKFAPARGESTMLLPRGCRSQHYHSKMDCAGRQVDGANILSPARCIFRVHVAQPKLAVHAFRDVE